MVIPRSFGGLQADPLTYLRAVELLAEGAGSVGWNLANNGIVQLVTLGLPDDGVREIYGARPDTVAAGTAVQGGGRRWWSTAAIASPGAGVRQRLARRRAGCSAASRSSTTASPATAPKGGRYSGAASSQA